MSGQFSSSASGPTFWSVALAIKKYETDETQHQQIKNAAHSIDCNVQSYI